MWTGRRAGDRPDPARRGASPATRLSCEAVLATNRRLTALLLTLRLGMSAGSGSRLLGIASGAHADQGDCSTVRRRSGSVWAIVWEGRERHLLAPRARPGGRRIDTCPPPEDDGTGHRTRPATPCGRLGARSAARRSPSDPPRAMASRTCNPDRTARSNSSASVVNQLTRRAAADAWSEIQHRRSDGLCETSSWRLLCCEAWSRRVAHHSCITSS